MKTLASLSDSISFEDFSLPGMDEGQLIEELRAAKEELDMATRQFEFTVEPMLVDHIIFRLGAAEKRMNYLLQIARRMNLVSNRIRWDREGRG